MTFEQLAHDHLFNNGMFEQDVQKVLAAAKSDDLLKDTMQGRWSDSLENYPPPMISIFILSLNRIAVEYIDEHMPRAWFRKIFA